MGDFNAKVGDKVKIGNKEANKGGKELVKMCKESGMEIINALDNREGAWTRIENGKRSVIDYILIEKKDSVKVKRMKIDEEKEWSLYYVKKREKFIQTTVE